MNREDYQAYLASRQWALKREAVRDRSNGQCERCWINPMMAVHHLTYARVGDERLEDLLAICDPCHEYFSCETCRAGWPPLNQFSDIDRDPWQTDYCLPLALAIYQHKGRTFVEWQTARSLRVGCAIAAPP
jgi:hypothetical protein